MIKTNLPVHTVNNYALKDVVLRADQINNERNPVTEFFYELGFRDNVLNVISLAITQQLKKENISQDYYLSMISNWSKHDIQMLVVTILNENRTHSSILSHSEVG